MILNMILNPSSWLSIRVGLIGLYCKLSTFKTLFGLKWGQKLTTKIGDKNRLTDTVNRNEPYKVIWES